MSVTAQRISSLNAQFFGDLLSLTKPKITIMALMVAVAGLIHARVEAAVFEWAAVSSLLGIAFLVSGSSALNMYMERVQDGKMTRTKDRPLPAGRLNAWWAVGIGVFCMTSGGFLLAVASNGLTLVAGLLSLVLYVWCYTPMKQKSWTSLLVGSIPGAMPAMLGYMSKAGAIDDRAIALFLWAFLWQIPHFLAISLFREQEYTAAGFEVMSARFGVRPTKVALLLSSILLVCSTGGLFWTDLITGPLFVISLSLGGWFLWVCGRGMTNTPTHDWARSAFKASLVYQTLVFLLLIMAAII